MFRFAFPRIAAAFFLAGSFSACESDEGPLVKDPGTPADSISFANDIQPLFNAYCTPCHGAANQKLNLLPCCSYEQLLLTGFRAPYVLPSNPEGSLLYQYLNGNPIQMPPSGPIPPHDIESVLLWIRQGAKNN